MFDYDTSGQLIGIYCNVSCPPERKEGSIEWVDLDLDVVADRSGRGEIVDIDEFETNSVVYSYGEDVVERAMEVAVALKDWIHRDRLTETSVTGCLEPDF